MIGADILLKKGTSMQSSVLDLIYQRAGMFGDRDSIATYRNGVWHVISFEDVRRGAHRLSNYLIAKGIERDDRLALLSESNAEAGIVFFACARAGGILVPLDPSLTVSELIPLLLNSQPRILFCSNAQLDMARQLKKRTPFIERIIVTDVSTSADDFEALSEVSTHILQHGRERELGETATIAYTAGTTGSAKGVMISYSNLLFQADCQEKFFQITKNDVLLSILPISDLFELNGGYLAALHSGAQICYAGGQEMATILRLLKEKKVTCMIVTPVFLQRLADQLNDLVSNKSATKLRAFKCKVGLARLLPPRLRKKFFPEITRILGKHFNGFLTAGTPLDARLARSLDALGIAVFQGYSVSETSSLISINNDQQFRLCSVGKPMPQVEVRISEETGSEGEILTRGPHVMKGYFQNEALTEATIDAKGWLRTGDIGYIDEEGFLHVLGRKEDVIVSGGEPIHPEEIEAAIKNCRLVKDVCVLPIEDAPSNKPGKSPSMTVVIVPHKLDKDFVAATRQDVRRILTILELNKTIPRIVFSTIGLPRTQSGKLKRREARALLAADGVMLR